jgi:nucleoside-diphosphate-sugar epimerase
MKVLITGSEGYLGSLLGPVLSERGYDVTGLDTGYYNDGRLYSTNGRALRTLAKDIRHLTCDDLRGHDAVVHMAELSNDPLGELDSSVTYEINHKGTLRLANAAKSAGVKRFIYMSSCSVYGVATNGEVTEQTKPNPQTAYAICKTLCERDLKQLASKNFVPCYFRNATAFGASPRQRFDVLLNNLCGLAWTTREIRMISDGTPWRPLVHGLDIAQAISHALEAPAEAIYNEIFNVGSNGQNSQVKEVAEKVAKVFPGCTLIFGSSSDNRSYRVNFDKIGKHLSGFECEWDADKGVEQFYQLFHQIDFTLETFEYRAFTRLKQLQYLIRTGQIDNRFFWTQPSVFKLQEEIPNKKSMPTRVR